MKVFLLNIYFSFSILLRIDITQVVCRKLNLKQYFQVFMNEVLTGFFFNQHVKISSY